MGYTTHEVLIVTSQLDDGALELARLHAAKLGLPVTEIIASPWNGWRTFMVAPDGSKEGWAAAEAFEAMRAALIVYLLDHCYSDGSSCLDFCLVTWGEEGPASAKLRRDFRREREEVAG